MKAIGRKDITGVVLAGGRGRRLGGEDKGLIEIGGRPLAAWVVERLRPQTAAVLINANRNAVRYASLGCEVIPDAVGDYWGPLAGMASALGRITTPYLITAPCDAPLIPTDLVKRMSAALLAESAEIAVAHDGEQAQHTIALVPACLYDDLMAYLEDGGRRVETWLKRYRLARVRFDDRPGAFINMNTPEDRQRLEALLGAEENR